MTEAEQAAADLAAAKRAERRQEYEAHGDDAPWLPKSRFDSAGAKAAADVAAEKARADKLAADLAAAQAAATERDQLKADLATERLSRAFEVAAVRAGLDDADDVAEFRDRYDRLQPGEDGKKPTPAAWMAALKEKPPKWAKAYFEAPKKDGDDEVEDPPGVRQEPAQKVVAPKQDVNANTRSAGGGAHRRVTDDAAARMSGDEWRASRATVAKDLIDGGQIRLSDADKKSLGLA